MIENQCAYCSQNKQTGECVGDYEKKCVDIAELKEQVNHALQMLYENDFDLIDRQVDERSISHRFARYFENEYAECYLEYHFDVEYQKNGETPKYYDSQHYARPDFIIHRRKCNKHNLIMVEFKGHWQSGNTHEDDYTKLQAFTTSDSIGEKDGKQLCYNYIYGAHIVFHPGRAVIKYIKNGEAEPFFRDEYMKGQERNG